MAYNTGYHSFKNTREINDYNVNNIAVINFIDLVHHVLEWVKSSHIEETNEILKPSPQENPEQKNQKLETNSVDINLLSLNELLALPNTNKEIKQQIETIFLNITLDLESMARKASNPDYKKLFELLSLKYNYEFVSQGNLNQIAQDIVYKMKFKLQQDNVENESIDYTQNYINKFSKSVRASFEDLKINKFASYNKAISLFKTILDNGGVNSFLAKINTPTSEVLSFGVHPYNGGGEFKNSYIFEIGDANRVIIHRVTGQVLFIGNPSYHR